MSKVLLRTKLAIDECEQHLTANGGAGTSIEAYLAQYILIVMCADVQQEIYRFTDMKAATLSAEFQLFVAASAKRLFRSVQKDELAAYLGCFGPQVKDALNAAVNDADVTMYNNAVSARHDVAHKQGTRITFAEAKLAYAAAMRILTSVATAMGITIT